MIKLFSVKVLHPVTCPVSDQIWPIGFILQEKQKKDAAAGKGIKQSAGELRLQKGPEALVVSIAPKYVVCFPA